MRSSPPLLTALAALAALAATAIAHPARAADVNADPSNYVQVLGTLHPGDTLHLAAGTYAPTGSTPLPLSNLNGTPSQWITVTGPAADPPTAIIQASPDGCCNIVEITRSSYLAVEHLLIDGNHVDSAFGISAKGGTSNLVHDIRIEDNTLVHIDNDGDPADLGQQDVGITTKTPTWGWIIRRNKILGAGTGLYLGNSDGSDPFVAGIIDDNLVDKPTGYCMEIKQQNPWPTVAGMPEQPTATLISNNVFVKYDHAATTSGGRPNVLVDGFPDTGPGSHNHYEIYGNLFVHDSDDFLLQATGRVHVHDNLFVDDSANGAVNFTNHDGKTVIDAIAYNNTIYGVGTGIGFSSAPSGVGFAAGNAIYAATPLQGSVATQTGNIAGPVAQAAGDVASPSITFGAMDFYPKTGGALDGAALNLSSVAGDVAYDRDFNCASKGGFTYRGAYAGSGANPGWKLAEDIKAVSACSPDGGAPGGDAGGADATSPSGDGGGGIATSSDGGSGAPPSAGSSGGCGCAVAGAPWSAGAAVWLLPLLWCLRRRLA